MILGDGFLADGVRATFGEAPLCWVLDHPALLPLRDRLDDADIVIISTPILVGTIAKLEAEFPQYRFGYVPENVRQAHPEDWRAQERFVVGCRDRTVYDEFAALVPWAECLFMSPESAEMTKHALNGFLAMSCEYAVDIGRIAAENGADPDDVAWGMMSDPRIGMGAYLKPHGAPGPHLQREVDNLKRLGL